MAYTDIDKPTDYFNTVLYTGNGSTQSITGVGFQPDWVWIKGRSSAVNHNLWDVIRGTTKYLISNNTGSENTDATLFNSFNSDGFTVGNGGIVNDSGVTYVGWCWKANGSGSSNTDGSITSTVSANTTSGFSIVSYTGTGSASTVGHGLGSVPACYFIKQRNTTGGWIVYHQGNTSAPETEYLRLDKDDSTVDDAIFNDTLPTSSVFSIGTNAPVNTSSGTYIAYCFAEKKGFSKFGSYTGNGSSDGAFIYTGFKPAMIIIKKTNGVEEWGIYDNKRDPFNVADHRLFPNLSDSESTTTDMLDFTSNGFKCRTSNNMVGASGGEYIYMAFAENPFVTSTGIPGLAR